MLSRNTPAPDRNSGQSFHSVPALKSNNFSTKRVLEQDLAQVNDQDPMENGHESIHAERAFAQHNFTPAHRQHPRCGGRLSARSTSRFNVGNFEETGFIPRHRHLRNFTKSRARVRLPACANQESRWKSQQNVSHSSQYGEEQISRTALLKRNSTNPQSAESDGAFPEEVRVSLPSFGPSRAVQVLHKDGSSPVHKISPIPLPKPRADCARDESFLTINALSEAVRRTVQSRILAVAVEIASRSSPTPAFSGILQLPQSPDARSTNSLKQRDQDGEQCGSFEAIEHEPDDEGYGSDEDNVLVDQVDLAECHDTGLDEAGFRLLVKKVIEVEDDDEWTGVDNVFWLP